MRKFCEYCIGKESRIFNDMKYDLEIAFRRALSALEEQPDSGTDLAQFDADRLYWRSVAAVFDNCFKNADFDLRRQTLEYRSGARQ